MEFILRLFLFYSLVRNCMNIIQNILIHPSMIFILILADAISCRCPRLRWWVLLFWRESWFGFFTIFSLLFPDLVSDIQCSFSAQGSSASDSIAARLKKPVGFKGAPLFADDRSVNPETDRTCLIRQDIGDPDGITYNLKITDFTRCGVLKRNVSHAKFKKYFIQTHLIQYLRCS